jgi:hypothetical protein
MAQKASALEMTIVLPLDVAANKLMRIEEELRHLEHRLHSAALVPLSIAFLALPRNQLRLRRDARNQLIQPSKE